MTAELIPAPIACLAEAAGDGVATTKHFMLTLILDDGDSEMFARALNHAHQLLTMGDKSRSVLDLRLTFR